MFDTHLHTTFSTDSKMMVKDAVERARELEIGITVTEHMDLNYPIPEKFQFNVDKYFEEYSAIRNDKLLLGIEMGMRPDCVNENQVLSKKYDFDYIIGSVHLVDNMDIFTDEFYKGRSKRDAYELYLKYMADCLKKHNFVDSLGHIDYVSRYARYEDREIYYSEFSDYIDEVLKIAVDNEKALEINTRRFEDEKAIENLIDIYKRFHELGGRVVTIGSDSHNTASIGMGLKKAFEVAHICNLKVVYFKNRKKEYVKF